MTAFDMTSISFTPRLLEMQAQSMRCEGDLAVCNRECERLYGEHQLELEEPCKLAVVEHFAMRGLVRGAGKCFPQEARVIERRRGSISIGAVQVGDELASARGFFSPVVALLHANHTDTASYVRLRCDSGLQLHISPEHLVRARQKVPCGGRASGDAGQGARWAWLAAQDVLPGSELEDACGAPALVVEVLRASLRGIFAPLTRSGTLVVDGVLCSCYAPPAAWAVSHEACHVAMAPLRLLAGLREAVEWCTEEEGGQDQGPVLTAEVVWLLPRYGSDVSVHPWASGLLWAACLAQEKASRWQTWCAPHLGGAVSPADGCLPEGRW